MRFNSGSYHGSRLSDKDSSSPISQIFNKGVRRVIDQYMMNVNDEKMIVQGAWGMRSHFYKKDPICL